MPKFSSPMFGVQVSHGQTESMTHAQRMEALRIYREKVKKFASWKSKNKLPTRGFSTKEGAEVMLKTILSKNSPELEGVQLEAYEYSMLCM